MAYVDGEGAKEQEEPSGPKDGAPARAKTAAAKTKASGDKTLLESFKAGAVAAGAGI